MHVHYSYTFFFLMILTSLFFCMIICAILSKKSLFQNILNDQHFKRFFELQENAIWRG